MTRPTYETEHDEKLALSIVKRGIEDIAYSYAKLPKWYKVDFALLDQQGQMIGVAECKARTKKYPTIILSLGKVMKLLEFDRLGMQAWFMVSLETYVHRIQITPTVIAACITGMGGRWDRSDSDDREPVVHLPLDHFQRLE